VETVGLEQDREGAVSCTFTAFCNVDKDPAPVLVPEHSRHLLVELLPGICRLIESDDRACLASPNRGNPLLLRHGQLAIRSQPCPRFATAYRAVHDELGEERG